MSEVAACPAGVDAFLDPVIFLTAEDGLSGRIALAVGAPADTWLTIVAIAYWMPTGRRLGSLSRWPMPPARRLPRSGVAFVQRGRAVEVVP